MKKQRRARAGTVARVKQDLAIYRAARRRIANKARWAYGTLATTTVTRVGQTFEVNCNPSAPDAQRWCAIGALRVELAERGLAQTLATTLRFPLDDVAQALYEGEHNIVNVNDHVGHKHVLRVFDKVIEAMAKTLGGK